MSDIVERLRGQAIGFGELPGNDDAQDRLEWQAADEIERLRSAYAETRMRQAELETTEAELVEALELADRAFTLHVFSPRGHDRPEDRDTCRICGGNYRDTRAHITAQEGHPSDVKAEAIKRVRTAIANAKEAVS